MNSGEPSPPGRPAHPSFAEALRVWLKIGLLGFGGPAGQIALMHRIVVEEKRWIGEARFLHALNYCMLLPGPEAQQLATYMGWLLHRTWGGVVAGTLFVLPGALVILVLSLLYAGYQELAAVKAIFYGIKAAVLAVVVEALLRIGRRALANRLLVGLAAASFIGIFFLGVPFPLIVLGAGILGFLGAQTWPTVFVPTAKKNANPGAADAVLDDALSHTRPSAARAVKVTAACLALWFGPTVLVAVFRWPGEVFDDIGLFFSKMAVVTFGGAYAVLAYVAQEAVQNYGWLAPGEMLDGLGLAETTPGPLILVLQFVGFLAAYRAPGALEPVAAGILGAVLTTWVTFAPSFLWIFLGAPYVERLRGHQGLTGALTGITAAVVGVILNLAVWFAVHVVFAEVAEARFGPLRLPLPDWTTVDPFVFALAAAALYAMLRLRAGMVMTLAACAAVGAGWFLLVR
jgi:chromate transporter